MTPEMVFFAVRGLVRVGAAARDAYAQKVRDADFKMPLVRMPKLSEDARMVAFFGSPQGRVWITPPDGPAAAAWDAAAEVPREDPAAWRLCIETYRVARERTGGADAQPDWRGERFGEEPAAWMLLEQWGKDGGPPPPMTRVALALADVALDYLAANPGVMGVGGNGEKLLAGLCGNLRELLPDADDKSKWQDNWWRHHFAERAVAVALHAGLKTLGEHPDLLVEEAHLQALMGNVLKPLVAGFAAAPDHGSAVWVNARDALLGPMVQAALGTLAEHQEAFLGRRFDAENALGAISKAVLEEAATVETRVLLTEGGLLRLHRAALGVVVERPELLVRGGRDKDVVARALIKGLAGKLRDAQPPFDGALAIGVGEVVLDTLREHLPLVLDPNDPWENVAISVSGSLLNGLKTGLGGKASEVLERFLSREQAVEIARIVLQQAMRTPGMVTGEGARDEVQAIVAAIAAAMAADDRLLIHPDGWMQIVAVAAEEAARNPGRLFRLGVSPADQLGARVIGVLLGAAAADFRATGRKGGAVLFGATLAETVNTTLKAAANNADAALANIDKLEILATKLNELVAAHPGEVGAREWKWLYARIVMRVLHDGDVGGLSPEDLLKELFLTTGGQP